jgi:hypothetical protein
MFKLIATVRGGSTNSTLIAARFASIEDARVGAKQLMHENARVSRIMIVHAEMPVRFAEWIEKS